MLAYVLHSMHYWLFMCGFDLCKLLGVRVPQWFLNAAMAERCWWDQHPEVSR